MDDEEQIEGEEGGGQEGEDGGAQKPEPKISLVEVIFVGLFLACVAIVNLVIPFAGDVTGPAIGGLMFLYLYMKGLWNTATIVSNSIGTVAEMFPILQAFPDQILSWIAIVIIDRNPKLEKVTAVAGALEGAGGAGGAEGAAGELGGAAKAGGATAAAQGEAAATEAGEVAVQGQGAATTEAAAGTPAAAEGKTRTAGTPDGAGEEELAGEGMPGREESPEERRRRENTEEIEEAMQSEAERSPFKEMQEESFPEPTTLHVVPKRVDTIRPTEEALPAEESDRPQKKAA